MTTKPVILITHGTEYAEKIFKVPSHCVNAVLLQGSTLQQRETWKTINDEEYMRLHKVCPMLIEIHESLDMMRPKPADEQYLKRKERIAAGEIGPDDTDVESDSEESASKSIKIE